MPSFLAVRCCECKRFQVQQQTKAARFTCPVCGQKQSVLKVFLSGSRAKGTVADPLPQFFASLLWILGSTTLKMHIWGARFPARP